MALFRYRADIDGLRAVAVLAVVANHYGVPLFGGYVGVDVFFVISGYLITALIKGEMEEDKFSMLAFYARRVRRIFPALVVVCIASLAVGYFVLLPQDFQRIGYQAASAVVGVSNVYFWKTTDYFAPGADELPLLHTWSLGVEEQFYLLWPMALALLHRNPLRPYRKLIVGVGLVAAFVGAVVLTRRSEEFAFFMLPARAWELGLGAAIAFAPILTGRYLSHAASWLGIVLIGSSFVLLNDTLEFPGIGATLPCLGAALLVWPKSHADAAPARLLSSPPLVAVGRLSYSLYLWHWPVIVLFGLNFGSEVPAIPTALIALALSAILAWLSYRFVEKPMRLPWFGFSSIRTILAGATASALVLGLGLVVVLTQGLPTRFDARIKSLEASAMDVSPYRATCHRKESTALPIEDSCVLGDRTVVPSVVVWSDSHGVELSAAIGEAFQREGLSLVTMTYSSCPPALGFKVGSQPGCPAFNDAVLADILSNANLKTVILTANFIGYDTETLHASFARTVSALRAHDKKVVVFGPTPILPYSAPRQSAMLAKRGAIQGASLDRQAFDQELAQWEGILDQLQSSFGIEQFDAQSVFCGSARCDFQVGDQTIMFDKHHLSMVGARRWVQEILDSLLVTVRP